MRCMRFDLRRKFLLYLEGEVPSGVKNKLEKHLRACADCRSVLIRLRDGDRFARLLNRREVERVHRAPEFQDLMPGVEVAIESSHLSRSGSLRNLGTAVSKPWVVQVLAAVVVAQLALLVLTNLRVFIPGSDRSNVKRNDLDLSGFRSLSISDVGGNTLPRIATEGYVREVHVDKEERTIHFKLVESPQGSENFVVCEMISPLGLPVPREGSRVRVYGIARFDAQADRNWHEVNPVLDIAVLKK